MRTDYENYELSEYFALCKGEAINGREIKQAVIIREAPVGITSHYARQGTLKGIHIKGVGSETLSILEVIIKIGHDDAIDYFQSSAQRKAA